MSMNIVRFIFPVLFVRNWYTGAWEFSRARFVLFVIFLFLMILGLGIMYILHAPVVYDAPTS